MEKSKKGKDLTEGEKDSERDKGITSHVIQRGRGTGRKGWRS